MDRLVLPQVLGLVVEDDPAALDDVSFIGQDQPSVLFDQEDGGAAGQATDRLEKIRRPSGTREMPRATISAGDRPMRDSPSNRMSPFTGRRSPMMLLSAVVLPAPLAPMRATISPLVDGERGPFQREDVPVGGLEIADLKHSEPAPAEIGLDDRLVALDFRRGA